MAWFNRKREEPPKEPPQEPPKEGPVYDDPNDWVVMPYRIAEAARISLHTIAMHPDVPDSLRLWIGTWLYNYNSALSTWFQGHYGPDVFPILNAISQQVRSRSERTAVEEHNQNVDEAFNKWEQQFKEGE